jgi:putative membrane protein
MFDYEWIKAFHIIAVISWMAALLYLPRLYVYHAEVAPESEAARIFQVMERKLLRVIATPAMLATWALGLTLASMMGWDAFRIAGWLHAKMALVLLLSAFQGWLSVQRRAFARGRYPHSSRFYRRVNEIPAMIMVVIVLLVVIKPF